MAFEKKIQPVLEAYRVYRVNHPMTAFDFVRQEDEERKSILRIIRQAIGSMPSNTTPERLQEIRTNCIASLIAKGRKDATDLFDEAWPNLKPKKKSE
jgi:hypothetical protein